MIQRGVPRHRLEPTGRGRTRADLVKALKGTHENGLCDVLSFGRVADQTDSRRKHHVLISPHKGFEGVGVGHTRAITGRPSLGQKTRKGRKSFDGSETGFEPLLSWIAGDRS